MIKEKLEHKQHFETDAQFLRTYVSWVYFWTS